MRDMQEYEDIPYQSLAFADTHPDRLAVLGRLFGLTPPAIDHCRVLELGCAEGGNLLPMAYSLPMAEFVGVELSSSQAEKGAANIARLGLNNISIHQGDILELGPGLGQFDYIIAHGVFSWVDASVRDKLLEITRQLISPNGLAYISYNINPGWRLRGVLRDLLLYHVRDIEQPRQRLSRAQELLPQIAGSLQGVDAPLAKYLTEQIERLGGEDSSYLYHEFLEAANQPMLFSEFIQQAGQHGLQYVCDCELYTMFASSLGAQAAPFIESFENLVEQEQYMDFLRGRGFRQSVLCHERATPDYDIDITVLEQFAVYADVHPQQQSSQQQSSQQQSPQQRGEGQMFVTTAGEEFRVNEPVTAAMLGYLGEHHPDSVTLPELYEVVKKNFPSSSSHTIEDHAERHLGELFNLFANGIIGLSTRARHFNPPNYDKPAVSALARLQAEQGDTVTTVWHRNLNVDHFAARLVGYLDGARKLDEIIELLVQEFGKEELPVNVGSQSHNTETSSAAAEEIRELVIFNCQRLLTLFVRHGLFEAGAS